jgi:hypothetical protein
VNVLAAGMSRTEIVEAGARRVSVGGGLTWVAVDAMVGAATAIRERGDFSGLRRGRRPFENGLRVRAAFRDDQGVHGPRRIVLELVQVVRGGGHKGEE